MARLSALVADLIAVGLLPTSAIAFDPEQTFHKGAVLLSVEGGGGAENNFEPLSSHMGVLGVKWVCPLAPAGRSFDQLRGARRWSAPRRDWRPAEPRPKPGLPVGFHVDRAAQVSG